MPGPESRTNSADGVRVWAWPQQHLHLTARRGVFDGVFQQVVEYPPELVFIAHHCRETGLDVQQQVDLCPRRRILKVS